MTWPSIAATQDFDGGDVECNATSSSTKAPVPMKEKIKAGPEPKEVCRSRNNPYLGIVRLTVFDRMRKFPSQDSSKNMTKSVSHLVDSPADKICQTSWVSSSFLRVLD